ncbi:MAG: hypothetical protein AAF493_06240 [Pseudomonadota bacterium]
MPTIRRPEPRAWIVFAIAILVAVVLVQLNDRLVDWVITQDDVMQTPTYVYLLLVPIVVVAMPVIGVSWYLFRVARRTEHFDEFPPPGMWVLKETAVRSGATAKSFARRLRMAGWLMLGMGVAGPIAIFVVVRQVVAGAG